MSNARQDNQKNQQNGGMMAQRGIFTLRGVGIGIHPENLSGVKLGKRYDEQCVNGLTTANGTVQVADFRQATVEIVEQIVAKKTELAGLTEDPRLITLREAKASLQKLIDSGVAVTTDQVDAQIEEIETGMADELKKLERAIGKLEKKLVDVWYDNASVNVLSGDRGSFTIMLGDSDWDRPNMSLLSDSITLPKADLRYDLTSASKVNIEGGGKAYGFVRETLDRDGNVQVIHCSSQDMVINHSFQASAGELVGGVYVTIEIAKQKVKHHGVPYHMDLANAFGNLERQGALAEQMLAAAKRKQAKVVLTEAEMPVEAPADDVSAEDDNEEVASS